MQLYLLLALSILFAASNNLLLHKFANRGLDGLSGVLFFNAMISAVWIVLLGITAAMTGGLRLDLQSVGWGALYGSVTAAFLLCKMQAMALGPVSLTSFIGCASLLISTGFGVIVLHEGASVMQTIGVVLLMLALYLVVSPKNDQAQKSWKLWCGAFFVCSASVGIIFKLHQRSSAAENINGMMFSAAITSAVILALLSALTAKGKKLPKPMPGSVLPYLLGCGLVSCLYNRLNIFLAGSLPSVVFYPLFNGSVILLSTLAGVWLFREYLKKAQTAGIIIGAAALMLASGSADKLFLLIK